MALDSSFGPGWTTALQDLSESLLENLEPGDAREYVQRVPVEFLSSAKKKQLEKRDIYWESIRQEAKAVLRWHQIKGELPENTGVFRVSLPYFKLAGGDSFAFLRVCDSQGKLQLSKIGQGLAYIPDMQKNQGWKGMRIDAREIHRSSAMGIVGVLEIDWENQNCGTVSVDRNELSLSEQGNKINEWLIGVVQQECSRFATEKRTGCYGWLNYRVIEGIPSDDVICYWISRQNHEGSLEHKSVTWERVNFPATAGPIHEFRTIAKQAKNEEVVINEISWLSGPSNTSPHCDLGWVPRRMKPDKVLLESFDSRVVPIWEVHPTPASSSNPFLTARFPSEWQELSGILLDDYATPTSPTVIWNVDNRLTSYFEAEEWKWVDETFNPQVDAISHSKEILRNKARCAAWIALHMLWQHPELWRGILERDASFVRAVWQQIFGVQSEDTKIKFWVHRSRALQIISLQNWTIDKEIRWPDRRDRNSTRRLNGNLLPQVSSKWLVEIE